MAISPGSDALSEYDRIGGNQQPAREIPMTYPDQQKPVRAQ